MINKKIRNILTILSVSLLLIKSFNAHAALKTTHPRLMSQEWINQLTEWSNDPDWEPWQRFKAFADSDFGDKYDPGRLFAKTLMWKMGKGEQYLIDALNNFDDIINSIYSKDSIKLKGLYVAYAYDLLYDQLSLSSQKNAVDKFIEWQEIVKEWTPNGYRPLQGWFLRPWHSAFIAAAAGAYDPSNLINDLEDEYYYWKTQKLYPALYHMDKVLHGVFTEGTYYSTIRLRYILRIADVVLMAEGENLFNTYEWFKKAIIYQWQEYSIPYKMTDAKSSSVGWYYHPWGQSERLRVRVPNFARMNILHLMTRLSPQNNPYRNQIYHYLYFNSDPDLNKAYYDNLDYTALWNFLFGAKNLTTPETPSLRFWYTNKHKDLPVNDPNYEYGPGYGFMRTGYTSNDIYISYKCGDMIGRNHENLEDGTFQLFAKEEDLAIHSGSYDGDGRPSQTRNYFMRTVSMNGLIIYDPNERIYYKSYSTERDNIDNVGGQRYYYGGEQEFSAFEGRVESMFEHWLGLRSQSDSANNPSYANVRAKLLKADHIDDKYSYIFCDLTRAYNSDEYVEGASAGNTAKVSKVTREMALIGNKYFVVFDRIVKKHPTDYSATPKEGEPYPYQDKWLLHSPAMFTVNGVESVVSDGEQLYTNTDGSFYTYVKNFSQDGAYLYGKVVYPDKDFQIRKFNGSKQYWNYHKNVPQDSGYNANIPWGADRIEIEPVDTELYHKYLVVLYPAKPDEPAMPPIIEVESTDGSMVGAHIKDSSKNYVVMYSADSSGAEVTGTITYTIQPTADTQHFLFGVPANTTYDISFNTNTNTVTVTPGNGGYKSSSEGVLSFEITYGGQIDPPPAPPQNLRIIQQ